jgi:hypothetical protein
MHGIMKTSIINRPSQTVIRDDPLFQRIANIMMCEIRNTRFRHKFIHVVVPHWTRI